VSQDRGRRQGNGLLSGARRRLNNARDLAGIMRQVKNPRVLLGMLPSTTRGMLLQQGRMDAPTLMASGHDTHFDWSYRFEFPEMLELYRRAKQNQWDADVEVDWSVDVDPENPEVELLPLGFFNEADLAAEGIHLSDVEKRRFIHSVLAWMLSQFLHGEQGALHASAQVTESVGWMDAKLYGATQVVDEGRHVETFHRYLTTKLGKLYVVNDNLFVIIDALISDPRWDMKFLGMQIMVEGLALGAFGTIYRVTREPLLRQALSYIIRDEARHVHFGVLALKEHYKQLSDAERREREDWALEVTLLMRNRFMLHEVYEEWFEGMLSRRVWDRIVNKTPGMQEFRQVMFSRLIPNLRAIGLLSDRMVGHYERAGLMKYYNALDARELSGEALLADLDSGAAFVR